jgi:hypothetical protein
LGGDGENCLPYALWSIYSETIEPAFRAQYISETASFGHKLTL